MGKAKAFSCLVLHPGLTLCRLAHPEWHGGEPAHLVLASESASPLVVHLCRGHVPRQADPGAFRPVHPGHGHSSRPSSFPSHR